MEQTDKVKQLHVVYKTSVVSCLVNGLLVIFKLAAGFFGLSLAMLADAVHSFADYMGDLLVIHRLRMERRKKNDEHDYGFGRVTVFVAGVVGLILMALAFGLCYKGVSRLIFYFSDLSIPRPGMIAFIAALTSIVVKAVMWKAVGHKGKSTESELLLMRAWQHRNDAITSLGTAIGIGVAMFCGSKWRLLDPITCLIVCGFIVKMSWLMLKGSFYQLTDKSLPLDVEARIAELARTEENVVDVYEVLTRRIGSAAAIEMRIGIDGSTPLSEAYQHVQHIEQRILNEFGSDTHVGIRIEPAPVQEASTATSPQ